MKRPVDPRIVSVPFVIVAGAAALWCSWRNAAGADEPADRPVTFRRLLEQNARQSIHAVTDYIAANPEAEDIDSAGAWVFETASAHGFESDVLPLTETFLARRNLDSATRQLAQSTRCIGLARNGNLDEALSEFGSYLQGARFQSAFKSLDLAGALSAQARIAGNLAASKAIYERVASANPLNAQIVEIVEGRVARQELIGKPAPAVVAADTQGKPFELAALSGKVVLVDFWATNCAPCLAEFPNLNQIYQELHPQGFEIVGISFDDGPETVEAFRTRARLSWPMVMNESPQGRLSERFRTRTIPALFVIDKQGQVAQVDVRGPDLRRVIEGLLK